MRLDVNVALIKILIARNNVHKRKTIKETDW